MDIRIKKQDGLIEVWRLPPTKTLRAHFFGLTLGLVGAFFSIALDRPTLFGDLPWFAAIVAVGIFMLGTYIGGFFVFLTAILFFFANKQPHDPPEFFSSLVIVGGWYFLFYAAGSIIATFYNALAFLNVIICCQKQLKLAFVYDSNKKINIIKSPIADDEKAFNRLRTRVSEAKRKALNEQRLYPYELKEPPRDPYTIAFVANPKIWRRTGADSSDDPIINDLHLFLRTVNNALESFERDEVLGKHEIWSRVRIVTVFDNAPTAPNGVARSANDLCFLQDFLPDIDPQAGVAENLIYPRAEMPANLTKLLKENIQDFAGSYLDHIDVIFGFTASPTQIRHTAYYADFDERKPKQSPNPNKGMVFQYDKDPYDQKSGNIHPFKQQRGKLPSPFACIHDDYSVIPGRVAINALSARRHTFIHEFAHAMSSVVNGCIADEYYDRSFLRTPGGGIFVPFYVNRIERVESWLDRQPGQFVPTHSVFAKYNEVIFLSDLAHPSAEAAWLSYFPEPYSRAEHCTMDRTAEPFRFDKLISRFIYDRLFSKLNRPHS
jgi:hypothetical protein